MKTMQTITGALGLVIFVGAVAGAATDTLTPGEAVAGIVAAVLFGLAAYLVPRVFGSG